MTDEHPQVKLDQISTITSPDSLMEDSDSMEFFILKDESVAICKHRRELPYIKNRATYLSSGRYSPKFKKVLFWPESIGLNRAVTLLAEKGYITSDYTYNISGTTTSISSKGKKKKTNMPVKDGVRKAELDILIKNGMRIQSSDKGQTEQPAKTDNPKA